MPTLDASTDPDFDTFTTSLPEWPHLSPEQRAYTRRAWDTGRFFELMAASW